jgi:hypothetical protein
MNASDVLSPRRFRRRPAGLGHDHVFRAPATPSGSRTATSAAEAGRVQLWLWRPVFWRRRRSTARVVLVLLLGRTAGIRRLGGRCRRRDGDRGGPAVGGWRSGRRDRTAGDGAVVARRRRIVVHRGLALGRLAVAVDRRREPQPRDRQTQTHGGALVGHVVLAGDVDGRSRVGQRECRVDDGRGPVGDVGISIIGAKNPDQ